MTEPMQVIVYLEIDRETEAIRGSLSAPSAPDLRFTGWMGLALAIEQARKGG